MKPWLLNILACPIDKHHPLEAYFFRWETSEEEIGKLGSGGSRPKEDLDKRRRQLAKQLTDGTISPPAMAEIVDKTGVKDAADMLTVAKERIALLQDKTQEELLEGHTDDLDAIHGYLNMMEVDAGLLACPECGRWYPIGSAVETIPEMLPDGLRDRERDLQWLQEWRQHAPEHVTKNGKPYSLD